MSSSYKIEQDCDDKISMTYFNLGKTGFNLVEDRKRVVWNVDNSYRMLELARETVKEFINSRWNNNTYHNLSNCCQMFQWKLLHDPKIKLTEEGMTYENAVRELFEEEIMSPTYDPDSFVPQEIIEELIEKNKYENGAE